MSRSVRERLHLDDDESPAGIFLGSLLADFTRYFVRAVAVLLALDLWHVPGV